MHDFIFSFLLYVFIFIQGDEEKRQGLQPQALMDRSLAHELPKNQVVLSNKANFHNLKTLLKYRHTPIYLVLIFHNVKRWDPVSLVHMYIKKGFERKASYANPRGLINCDI